MVSTAEQKLIGKLQSHWIWTADWVDSSTLNTAGRLVEFSHSFTLESIPSEAIIHFSADTRYKLYINNRWIAVGPARSSPNAWYYDTLDIAPHLKIGTNEVRFLVVRYFSSTRYAMPFMRGPAPGLTVVGTISDENSLLDVSTGLHWTARIDESVQFPTGLVDDVFLHINERVTPTPPSPQVAIKNYGIKTLNGELAPWRLRPRAIPMPEQTHVAVDTIRSCDSSVSIDKWAALLSHAQPLHLPAHSKHVLEIQAAVHSTAFVQWSFRSAQPSTLKLKTTYSEGYESKPRSYPFFRTKANRLDAEHGKIIGPYDEVALYLRDGEDVNYAPFWFRTFFVMRWEIEVGTAPASILAFSATQVNYPLNVKASLTDHDDPQSGDILEVSIRTMRNCMFDGYSDCPFYEQLQYGGDTYPVGLFHYLISGDDRLMRQAISNFAASITEEGLTQSRFPSHVPQIIAGFSLYWILQICGHYLFFGDREYARGFVPRIDGVLDFFDRHVDELGLVSGLPEDAWQFVDWVTTWGATDEHPDKGVPTSGRRSNRHTFFSLLYAHVLQKAAQLVRAVGRPGHATEYEARSERVLAAVRKHCYDGQYFTDSTADIADENAYSQHCQVFAVISGAAPLEHRARLLQESRSDPRFSKCSYFMQFYALRAYALAGDDLYDSVWPRVWDPWRKMLANNMTTWEEDDVRQRSDCHAWGSVPIYEYCTELAGIQPVASGCSKILFKPRIRLSRAVTAKVALGRDNLATVSWTTDSEGCRRVVLRLEKSIEVVSQLPGGEQKEHGIVDHLELIS